MIGADFVRDAVHWDEVETEAGVLVFEGGRFNFPDRLAEEGIDLLAVFSRHNRLYDPGTPFTPEAQAAFGNYVDAFLTRFPDVKDVEIGNEFNAQNFVVGPVREAGYDKRPAFYAGLASAAVEPAATHGATLLLGAAHSIPIGWFRDLAEAGVLDDADGLVIHPYSSPPEHVGNHIDLLRNSLGRFADMPLDATEFGREVDDAMTAAAYLVRMTTALAEAEVRSAAWYALREQSWHRNMGLFGEDGAIRPAGNAFKTMVGTVFEAGKPERLDYGPRTWAVLFGDRVLVTWGARRGIEIEGDDVRWLDTTGAELSVPPGEILPDRPIIVITDTPLRERLKFAPEIVLADSFYDFRVGAEVGATAGSGNWQWLERRGDGVEAELVTMGGGDLQSEPWRPYLGGEYRRPLSVTERSIRPVDFDAGLVTGEKSYSIVERLDLGLAQSVDLCMTWTMAEEARVRVAVSVGGREIVDEMLNQTTSIRVRGVTVDDGEIIEFVASPAAGDGGATVRRRYVVGVAGESLACNDFD